MTKKELIQNIQEKSHVKSKEIVDAIMKALISEIHTQEKLFIQGLGTFKHVVRAARTARNPINGEAVQVPEKTVLTFKASR
jgi:nucleoid DNA-binding protein